MLANSSCTSQSARRTKQRKLRSLEDEHPTLSDDAKRLSALQHEISNTQQAMDYSRTYVAETVRLAVEYLQKEGFVDAHSVMNGGTMEPPLIVTAKGAIAANVQEIHSLMAADAIVNNTLSDLTSTELAALLSCFASVRTADSPPLADLSARIQKPATYIQVRLEEYEKTDAHYQFDVAEDYTFTTALVDAMTQWCQAETPADCNQVFTLLATVGIFKGEFIKATLKVTAVAQELEKVAEMADMGALAASLSMIPRLVLKHVATNQSLYLGI